MTPVRLKNASEAPVINSRAAEREDSLIVPVSTVVEPGKVGEFNGDNPSVQVYVRGRVLVASDATAKKWAEGLSA